MISVDQARFSIGVRSKGEPTGPPGVDSAGNRSLQSQAGARLPRNPIVPHAPNIVRIPEQVAPIIGLNAESRADPLHFEVSGWLRTGARLPFRCCLAALIERCRGGSPAGMLTHEIFAPIKPTKINSTGLTPTVRLAWARSESPMNLLKSLTMMPIGPRLRRKRGTPEQPRSLARGGAVPAPALVRTLVVAAHAVNCPGHPRATRRRCL